MSEPGALQAIRPIAPVRVRLARVPELEETFRFVSEDGDDSIIAARLQAIYGATSFMDKSPPDDQLAESPLHDKIVKFLDFLERLGSDDSEQSGTRPDSALLVEKAHEYFSYLMEKCTALAVASPLAWDHGVTLLRETASPDPLALGSELDRHGNRREEALTTLAQVVAEQIDHMFNLCVLEIPERGSGLDGFSEHAALVNAEAVNRPVLRKDIQVSASFEIASSKIAKTILNGDLPRFQTRIEGDEKITEGDLVTYRVPLDVDAIWDPDFAVILAATINLDNVGAVIELRLGIGDDAGVAHEASRAPTGAVHITTAWRFRSTPQNPYLQIGIVLRATLSPINMLVSRLFAGHHYDPYILNPLYAALAAREGMPSFPGGEEVLREFERKARLACQTGPYFGEQAFVRPYIVEREGHPRFPMLIGTVNSINWYGLEPRHGLEEYDEWGCVSEGDIVMDCGAHAGETATLFSLAVGPRGRVIAFDPFAQNRLQIEAQDSLNAPGRIRVVQAGVGARRRTLRVSNVGQKTVADTSLWVADHTEVAIVPLDDFIDEEPTFIKIDVEGAEVDALIGAAQLLSRCTPKLFIEVHTQFLGQFGYGLEDFFSKIPEDLYEIYYIVLGSGHSWKRYEAALERGVSAPLMVFAIPKHSDQTPGGGADATEYAARKFLATELLIQREEEIRKVAGLVLEREETVKQLEVIIKSRESEITSRDAAIAEREASVAQLTSLLLEREAELRGRGDLIIQREATITHLESIIRKREAEVDERGALLLVREAEIRRLSDAISQLRL